MRWSHRVAEVNGIAIKIHMTFYLIVLFGAVQWGLGFGVAGAAFGALLMLLLFACVTLHELGHSLVAKKLGVPVREIVLLPLGGVAIMEKPPRRAFDELLIAIAGPLVNVVIAIVLALVIAVVGGVQALAALPEAGGQLSWLLMVRWLLLANVALILFNMLPAFPLDGGRILRAGLSMVIDKQRATAIATVIGQALAILLGVVGLISGNLLLALIAAFIFFGAGQERTVGQVRGVFQQRQAGEVYNRHALTMKIDDRVSTAANYILGSYQPDFAVVHGGRPIGIVTRADVLRTLAAAGGDQYITSIMNRDFLTVDATTPLDQVQELMAEQQTHVAAVYDGESYLGLLSNADMTEAYSFFAIEDRQRAEQQAAPTQ